MKKEKTIYDLKLNETIETPKKSEVYYTRVPGGWLYEIPSQDAYLGVAVFIPYSDEFKT